MTKHEIIKDSMLPLQVEVGLTIEDDLKVVGYPFVVEEVVKELIHKKDLYILEFSAWAAQDKLTYILRKKGKDTSFSFHGISWN